MYLGASEGRFPSPLAPSRPLSPLPAPFPRPPPTRGLITGFAMLKLFSSRSKQTHLRKASNSIYALGESPPGSSINRGPIHYSKRYETYVHAYVLSTSSAVSERLNVRDQHFALKNAAVPLFSYRAAPSSILDGSPKVIGRGITGRFFLVQSLDRLCQKLNIRYSDKRDMSR